ncbi:uncharacterized protein LOC107495326 isoform X1 [Arachis duranensis]|uniref:Uncharacterized protein LOC107495326 isoform X1 n=1 Tax=Arachis duranensis TaxID=130453 RepID=A0A9C6THM1_ARADU|nr:uncharacterized protein LOC107495326 isoform X1 [Arachis duranensis]
MVSLNRRRQRDSGRRRCCYRRRELYLCDSDRRERFCDLWKHRRSSGLSFCQSRPCCRRRKSWPSSSPESGRRCRLRWLPDYRQTGSVIAAVPVQPFLLRSCCDGYCESGWELRFWLPSVRAEVERIL